MYISNGLSAVNGHKFYVCTNMPNYDIDLYTQLNSTYQLYIGTYKVNTVYTT